MPIVIANPNDAARLYPVDFTAPLSVGATSAIYPVTRQDWMAGWPDKICVKRIPLDDSASSVSNRQRFENVKDVSDALSSKYLVKTLDCFLADEGGKHFGYIVMERYDTDLAQFLSEMHEGARSVPPETLKRVFESILMGLSALSSKNLIHRDVKAKNILLKLTPNTLSYSSAALGDFGIIKDPMRAVTPPENLLGTLFESAPPEAFLELGIEGPSYDMYGAGLIWYQMFNANGMSYAQEYIIPAKLHMNPLEFLELVSRRGASASSDQLDHDFLAQYFNKIRESKDVFPKLCHYRCPFSNRSEDAMDKGARAFLGRLMALRPEDRFADFQAAIKSLGELALPPRSGPRPAPSAMPAPPPSELLIAVDGCAMFLKNYSAKVQASLELLVKHLELAKPGLKKRLMMYENLLDSWKPSSVYTAISGKPISSWWDKAAKHAGFGFSRDQSLLFAIDSLLKAGNDEVGKALLIFTSGPPLIPDGINQEIGFRQLSNSLASSNVSRIAIIAPDEEELSETWCKLFKGFSFTTESLNDFNTSTGEAAERKLCEALFGGTP
jgi:serine/threonine protein kinase